MRLLFVHDHYFYKNEDEEILSNGGFPWYLWDRYLKHFDHITVVGRYGGMAVHESFVVSSCKNVDFVFLDKITSISGLINKKKNHEKLFELIKGVDAVVARLPSENGLMALKLCRSMNITYAVEVVGCAWDALWNYGNLISKIYAPVLYSRMKYAVSKADNVSYVTSQFLQKRYKCSYDATTVSASNVDINEIDLTLVEEKIKEIKSGQLLGGTIRFGIIGNFKAKYKGIHIAIEALGRIFNENEDFKFELRILGKGNQKILDDLLNEYNIKNHVFFDGTLPNGKPVLNWLDNIDIYLQPSLTEGLPRTVIEAMSRANIVLGSKAGGIPELVDSDFLFDSGSVKSLMAKILEVISYENDQLISIVENNIEKASYYQRELLNKKRDAFYHNLKLLAKEEI